jgi:hypothetical protein
MPTTAETTKTVQVNRVYIKATPQAIWDAIPSPSGPRSTATLRWSNTSYVRGANSEPIQTRE